MKYIMKYSVSWMSDFTIDHDTETIQDKYWNMIGY